LSIDGIGPNTARALALISELIYGEHADWKDPVKYSLSNTSLHLVEKLEKRIKKLEKELEKLTEQLTTYKLTTDLI